MKFQLSFILFVLPMSTLAIFGSGEGIVLLTSDKQTRSGVLSADHRCTEYPQEFQAEYVQNTGSSHCAMWTDQDCKGNLFVVPAHYTMRKPAGKVISVIC
ncbi:hypothetical protein CU098_008039 [Rhizopus stolonifer]|uniref:Uncharacterized protein n=1 Tax=Rhizopus stolonifer TaxID=4846 RepID=A0A367KTZ9_RHIST|nr:hypothetical protein CU098_008039 [Rhizopus stolonifer]